MYTVGNVRNVITNGWLIPAGEAMSRVHTTVTIRRQDGVELNLTLDHDTGRVVLKKKDGTEDTLYSTYLEPLAASEPKGTETR